MGLINRAPMAQLVEHRVVTREVVSSTPAGPTLRVLKYLRNKCYLCNLSTWNVKEPPHHSKRVRHEVPGVVAVLLSLVSVAGSAVMFLKGLRCMTPRTQKPPQKGTLPSAR